MSQGTSIEWTDATWNPVRGCSRVSEGCRNCYAERQASRFRAPGQVFDGFVKTHVNGEPRWTGRVELIPSKLDEPLRWRKPRRIFVNSMSDLFHENLSDEAIAAVFAVMSRASRHTFQVLTKRPARAREFLNRVRRCDGGWITHDGTMPARAYEGTGVVFAGDEWPLPNVWLGVSVEDQATADARIPLLLQAPAALRFVSYEPALGPVTLLPSWVAGYDYRGGLKHSAPRIDWLIVGGESGPGARPFDVAWARSAVAQCKAAGVPVFVKQLGARPTGEPWLKANGKWVQQHYHPARRNEPVLSDRKGGDPSEWPEDLRVREFPEDGPR